MRVGALEFRPTLWPSLAVIVLLPVLVGLGIWQLERADDKQAILDARAAANQAPALALNDRMPSMKVAMHRRASVHGHFDNERQFLLDNQVSNGVAGYRILTPLRLAGSDRAILVDRGWVPAPARRDRLPDIDVGGGERRLTGRIDDGPSVGLRLGAAYVGDGGWPRRIQYLDYQAMGNALPYELAPYLLETGEAAQQVQPAGMRFGPRRHYGYAIQWFALATALVVIYVGVNLRRRTIHE